MQKSFKNNYLHFTGKEKNGTIVLLLLVLVLSILPLVYRLIFPKKALTTTEIESAIVFLDSTAGTAGTYPSRKSFYRPGQTASNKYSNYHRDENAGDDKPTLFSFDPNTLNPEGWVRLGVKPKTAAGIQNYLAKGGKFREASDIRKIWGIAPALQERLIPYVKINAAMDHREPPNNKPTYASNAPYIRNENVEVDINNGDSAAFEALPGIGIKLAARIVNFRSRLGGFYKTEQVGETFGLPDSTFQKIRPYLKLSGSPVRQINLNLATEDELKLHPYIRWQLAKVIVQYRSQHGNFASPDDLKKIMIITDEIYEKLSPYLKVGD